MLTVSSKIDQFGRVIIPKQIRKEMDLKPGDGFEIRIEGMTLVLVPYEMDKKTQSDLKAFTDLLRLNRRREKKVDKSIDLSALADEVNA
ncbi:MAG: AbrB/MazE/SpoVT family DNA-binding domain-containing protein [Calditrichaeota bacterium]|nr:AbrB/MazE/SpoVT family DNA-binding domain-containing protein [Calditrichota bacterium]MCB0270534.1 AbrB/MazE/SpoVT family DNA-binding domain-containing protein [Calditrichota bacterium]MCB9067278.1 AbrB/MazE/SpoVT family DNA-binding domain-containing protein [Calditrichia bacterium]HQU62987.1 AbrB/MazE/SpoVT family DNA-binding domain-containing protein [Nitrosomonas sp.]